MYYVAPVTRCCGANLMQPTRTLSPIAITVLGSFTCITVHNTWDQRLTFHPKDEAIKVKCLAYRLKQLETNAKPANKMSSSMHIKNIYIYKN